jgi:beta-lactamase class D
MIIFTSPLLMLAVPAASADDPALASLLQKRGLTGTVCIASLSGDTTFVHNRTRAETRYSPASTFKIPNTLIALEERAVRDEHDTIRWDGVERAVPAWNRDHCLESAFPASCVWFYQEIARRVGMDKYRSYLKLMSYGNEKSGNDVTLFWLDGSLQISAVEQVTFLRNVYRRSYPFKQTSYDKLERIMVAEKGPSYVVRAKTGRTGGDTDLGWYVGYATTPQTVWFFAMNIDIRSNGDVPLRREIAFEALRLKGIIP